MTNRPWSPLKSRTPETVISPLGVMLDTGFTGDLTLSTATIQQFGLPWAGRRTFEPANGEIFDFEAYLVSVSWHGCPTDALALKSDSTQMQSMNRLWGSRIVLDAMDDGEVTIEEIAPGE